MPLTTTPVTFELFTPLGDPASGVRVTCTLSSMQVDGGMVVRSVASGTTNGSGLLVLDLWPNTRGDGGSYYVVRHSGSATHQLKQDEFFIKVPESAGAHVKDIVVDVVPQVQATTPSASVIAAHIQSTDGHLTPQQIAAGAEAAIGITEGGVILDAQGNPVSVGGDYSDDDAISAVAGAMASGGGISITTSAGVITLTVAQATTLAAGLVRLAALAETLDPAITNRAVTPAGLRYVRGGSNGLASLTAAGLINRSELGLSVGDLASILPTGMLARTSASAVAGRTISVAGAGLGITDGNGLAGNPTLALSATMQAIAGLSPTTGGALYFTGSGSLAGLYTTSNWFRGSWAPLADAAAARTLLGLAAIATSGSASDLTGGTIQDGRLPGRLIGGWGRSNISDANSAALTGSYYIGSGDAGAVNAPFNDASANIDVRTLDSNGASYAIHTAYAVARPSGVKTRIRYKVASNFESWVDAPLLVTEQAALWAAKAHSEHSAVLQYPTTMRGSVTQSASQTTAVTLNAAQGSIKMAPGTLAAGASVEFQLNNTYIDESSMPIVVRRGSSFTSITASVLRFAIGYCIVRVTNTGTSAATNVDPALSFTILGVAVS